MVKLSLLKPSGDMFLVTFVLTNFDGNVFSRAIPSKLKHQFQNRSENRCERAFKMLECIIRCDACVVNMFAKL